jgi:putative transposase
VVSCTEGARVQPEGSRNAAHEALNRLLYRLEPDTTLRWREAEARIDRTGGRLIIDDTTWDKPDARKIALVHRHWSGKQRKVVSGINLVTLVWSDDTHAVPCADRLFDAPNDALTTHDHVRATLQTAKERGFTPRFVCFDRWYSGLANLKHVRTLGWHGQTQLNANRLVNPDGTGNRQLADGAIRNPGSDVHRKGYGSILIFRIAPPDGGTEEWATSDRLRSMDLRATTVRQAWAIETYHHDIKQFCGVERGRAHGERAQRNHIG